MTEVFIQIDGYPLYSISNRGRIINNKTGKVLKAHANNDGYMLCTLCGKYTKSVHRMVAIHFLPNTDNKKEVNHKDGNKANNDLANLEWSDHSGNMIHAYETGLQQPTWKGVNGSAHAAAKPVLQIDKSGAIVKRFGSRKEAQGYGFSEFGIIKCINGQRSHYKGFTWKNAE